VALKLKELNLDGVIIKESPRERVFGRLLKHNKCDWVLDLHSCRPEHKYQPDRGLLESPYLGALLWGGNCDHDAYNRFFQRFFIQYYNGKDVLGDGHYDNRWRNPRYLGLGLLWYRPLDQTLEFMKKLFDYLQHNSP